jgi:C4-dicarboxylate transporter, DctQ subunit
MLVVSTVVMLVEGFSRAAFSTSFFWAEELVRILMVAAFFVSLGATGRRGHHIRTDMLVAMVGPRARKAMDLFAALAGIAFCALLICGAWPQLLRYYTMGMVSESSLEWPLWLVFSVMPIGVALWLVYYLGALARVLRNQVPFEDPFPRDVGASASAPTTL